MLSPVSDPKGGISVSTKFQVDWKLDSQAAAFKAWKYIHSFWDWNHNPCWWPNQVIQRILLGDSYKNWGCRRVYKLLSGRHPLLLREKFHNYKIPSNCRLLHGVGVLARLHLCLSHLSRCGPFSLCCGRAIQLVFRVFSEKINSSVASDLVCPWEEVNLNSSWEEVSHLELLSSTHFLYLGNT